MPTTTPWSRIFPTLLAFATPCCLLGQQTAPTARLDASDGLAFENFGDAVAVSGSTAVVGAPGDDEWGRRDGAAYVFERDPDDGSWVQAARLAPLAPKGFLFGGQIDQGDNFGRSVAVSGDVVVVGAPGEDLGAALDAGAAYVFERDSGGDWDQVARLTAPVAAADRRFGLAVAVSGGTAVVGAPGDPSARLFVGSAFVFERDADGAWKFSAELAPAGGVTGDFTGFAVAIDGSTALVGAPYADPVGFYSGSAYVFERDAGGDWAEAAHLLGLDTARGDRFGLALGIAEAADGTATAVVGAPRHDVPAGRSPGYDAGAAYVFERGPSGTWQEVSKLVASDNFQRDRFGEAVAFAGDAAIVGAPGNNVHGVTGGYGSGSVYVFRPDAGGVWVEQEQLYDFDAQLFDLLGSALAVSGDTLFAGTPFNDDHGPASGSVMVFDLGS